MQRTAMILLVVCSVASADQHLRSNPNAALSGKTVVMSPSHGRMQNTNGTWRWQRPIVNDIQEDIHNNEIFIEYLQRYLVNAGATVESVRERSYQTAEVIVDDGQATYSGTWTDSSSTSGYYGNGYRYAGGATSVTARATFQPNLPRAGYYPVYVWFTQGGNRTRDARYRVHHTGGVTEVRMDQSRMGNHWRFLGEFYFDAGTSGKVVLVNQNSDGGVVLADGVRFGGGVGPSGEPRWREGSKAFLTYKGFSSSRGEVTIRPVYAVWLAGGYQGTWRRDFAYISLHTNGGGGTGCGTYVYGNGRSGKGTASYPSGLQTAADAYGRRIQSEIMRAVRAEIDPGWRDRGLPLANFGEVRECRNMVGCLIELGFHDQVDDAAKLRNPKFRHVAARAIYKGVLRSLEPNATVVPLPPEGLTLTNLGGGAVRVSWTPVADPLEPTASASSFKVYTSTNGFGFDNGTAVNGTATTLTGLTAGQPLFVRVAGVNPGGESLGSRVGGVVVGEPQRAVLLVDGFDRVYRHTRETANALGMFRYDDAIEHVTALRPNLPANTAVDYVANEALRSIDPNAHALTDWILGREGSVDRTFDPSEQGIVSGYLAGGGRLLASGTEIGWDLEARSGGVGFLNQTLSTDYRGDDARTRVAQPGPGTPPEFGAVGALALDRGRYELLSPDVLAPTAGADSLLRYDDAGASVAAVGKRNATVVAGFPVEALAAAPRRRFLGAVIAYLDPALGPPPAPPPPGSGGGGGAPPPGGGGGGGAPPPGGGGGGGAPPPGGGGGGGAPPPGGGGGGGAPPPGGGGEPGVDPVGGATPPVTPGTPGGSGSGSGSSSSRGCTLALAPASSTPTWVVLALALALLGARRRVAAVPVLRRSA